MRINMSSLSLGIMILWRVENDTMKKLLSRQIHWGIYVSIWSGNECIWRTRNLVLAICFNAIRTKLNKQVIKTQFGVKMIYLLMRIKKIKAKFIKNKNRMKRNTAVVNTCVRFCHVLAEAPTKQRQLTFYFFLWLAPISWLRIVCARKYGCVFHSVIFILPNLSRFL